MANIPYTLYPGKTVGPSTEYPYGSAQNVTVPGDETGTPWERILLNDVWGWQQALLDAAGIIPTGTPDQVGASQYLDAMRRVAGFPGTVVALCLNDTDPATFGVRILPLNGTVVEIVDYPELVTVTYVGDPLNAAVAGAGGGYYKSSDDIGAVPDTAGPYFVLPNAVGRFLRGVDDGQDIDPDGERYIGQSQQDSSISHSHGIIRPADLSVVDSVSNKDISSISAGSDRILTTQAGPPSGSEEFMASGRWYNTAEYGNQFYEGPAGATERTVEEESRPINVAVNWGVWY